jgi:hypothetical protein
MRFRTADKKDLSDECEVLNVEYSSNSKRQEKNSPIARVGENNFPSIRGYPHLSVYNLFITAA